MTAHVDVDVDLPVPVQVQSHVNVTSIFFPLLLLVVVVRLLLRRRRPMGLGLGLGRQRQLADEALSRLPSPPRRLPVIGHLHLVGSLPHVSLRDLSRAHARDGLLLLLRLGAVPTLVVSSPRAAEAVLRTHDHVFASRPSSPLADVLFYGRLDVAMAPYGERWRQAKMLLTAHLLSARKVRSFRGAREAEARLAVARARDAADAAAPLDLSALLRAYANVMCRAVSGGFFLEGGRNARIPELTDVVKDVLGAFKPQDYFPALARLDVLSRWSWLAKARALRRQWDDLFDTLIDFHVQRRQRQVSGSGEEEEEDESDFIDVMLSLKEEYGLTRDHIKAILMNMFNGGTDTTYLVIESAMAELARHPRAMAEAQAELRSNKKASRLAEEILTEDDGVGGMPYLKAVVKEALRLHPPGPFFLPHLGTADCEVEGHLIPAGTTVMVNAWGIGRDPAFWEDPEEFVPERFLDGGHAAAVEYRGQDFSYAPFGSGRRVCPGLNFGMASLEIVLANLLYHFDWEVPGGVVDMTEKFGVTVHRKDKLVLIPKHYTL